MRFPMHSLLELVQVPLDAIQSFRSVNSPTQFAYLLQVYLMFVSLMKTLNSTGPSGGQPLRDTT